MRRNLQGIALIFFSMLLAICFNILGYDTIFDLDLEWSHLFIVLGIVGVILNYIRPKLEFDEEKMETVIEKVKVKKVRSIQKRFNFIIVIVLVLLIGLSIGTYFTYNLYREEQNVENFTAGCSLIIGEHEQKIVSSSDDYEFVTNYKIGKAGYGYMLDESLDIILHPNTDIIGENINDFIPNIFQHVTDNLTIGDSQLIRYEYKGIEKMTYIYRDRKGNYLCIVGDVKHY